MSLVPRTGRNMILAATAGAVGNVLLNRGVDTVVRDAGRILYDAANLMDWTSTTGYPPGRYVKKGKPPSPRLTPRKVPKQTNQSMFPKFNGEPKKPTVQGPPRDPTKHSLTGGKSSRKRRRRSVRKGRKKVSRYKRRKMSSFMRKWIKAGNMRASVEVYDKRFYNLSTNANALEGFLPASENAVGVFTQQHLSATTIGEITGFGESASGSGTWGIFDPPPGLIYSGGTITGYAQNLKNPYEEFLIKNYKCEYTISNGDQKHLSEVWVFHFIAKQDNNVNVLTDIYQDYKNQQIFQGENHPYTAPTDVVFWSTPNVMRHIRSTRNWKMIKKWHFKFTPDTLPVKLSVFNKDKTWDWNVEQTTNDAGTGSTTYHKGISMTTVFVVRGDLGLSKGADTGVAGYTSSSAIVLPLIKIRGARALANPKQKGTTCFDATTQLAIGTQIASEGLGDAFGYNNTTATTFQVYESDQTLTA